METVRVSGDMDIRGITATRQLLLDRLASSDGLAVDMSEVYRIDSAGLAGLVEVVQAARVSGRSFRLLRVRDGVSRMIRFARLVARNATAVRPDDVEELKRHGFADAEIFDIAAAAAGRAFFTKVIESLGADADLAFGNIDASLKQALMVGRAIEFVTPDRLPDAIPTPERAVV